MPFKIIRNDITKMQVDAIVNTANTEPTYGDGVDTAVYEAAGVEKLLAARREIGRLEEGDVVITPAFNLPAKFIIHAVSPLFLDGESGEEEKLRKCYQRSLALALENQIHSIAFPLISTGGFGYPKEEGIRIAIDEINGFLLHHDMMIYLVVFDSESTKLGRNLYPDLESYIDQNFISDVMEMEYGISYDVSADEVPHEMSMQSFRMESPAPAPISASPVRRGMGRALFGSGRGLEKEASSPFIDYDDFIEEKDSALERRMAHLADTFQQYLLYLIEEKGLSNTEVYKRAILTKQLFSKIKNNPSYQPNKTTAMRLCVGAKLNLDETKDLLARAGFALSPSDKSDVIFSYFIESGVYDMVEIDIALEEYGLPHFID